MGACTGITDDGQRVWAYSPGHVWAARRMAEDEAARRGVRLTDDAGVSALIACAPGIKPQGHYEVYTFTVAS